MVSLLITLFTFISANLFVFSCLLYLQFHITKLIVVISFIIVSLVFMFYNTYAI